METLANLALGFSVALSPYTLMLAVIGCFIGTIIGALPGLGPSNGVAILIPISFALGLDATAALVLMTSVYYGAMYGGRISSILLNIPGDEPALMTTLDGYPMAKNGEAGNALVLSGVASFVGAFLATIGLILLAPLLARVAFLFGPAEYFALYLLAFCTLGGMASNNQAKSAIAACIGLGIAMIGVDSSSGLPRLTGGNLHLYDGVDFLVAIVGLFAIAELFFFIESHGKGSSIGVVLDKVKIPWKYIKETKWTMLRSSGVGFVAGLHDRKINCRRQGQVRHRCSKRYCGPRGRQQRRRRWSFGSDVDPWRSGVGHHRCAARAVDDAQYHTRPNTVSRQP